MHSVGEAADGQTHCNFQGEVAILFVVNSMLLVKSAKRRTCSICVCGQLSDNHGIMINQQVIHSHDVMIDS